MITHGLYEPETYSSDRISSDLTDLREGSRIHAPVRWPIPESITASAAVRYRNLFADALTTKSVQEIVQSYSGMPIEDVERMIAVASRRLLTKPLEGVGIEIGAGCGILSSLVARGQSIKQIYALEVVEKMALSIIPRVAAHVLGWGQTKITPVWGSFDDLRLPDNSIDFVIEIDSLHHSDNLSTTVSECARVLKPGGWLLCFDRCHPNSVTDEEVDKMLSRIYSPEFLTANCYPSDIILSRRDNGEHEYRLYEWEAAFAAAQLQLVSRLKLHKRVAVRHAMKGLASVLPDPIRRRVYNTENASLAAAKLWLFQRLGFSSVAAKEETIFLLKKAA